MKYLIIGNSIAATKAVETIREFDKNNKITIISDEPYFNYSRPLISYLLAKKLSINNLNYLNRDFYQKNKVQLILNKKVIKIKEKRVILNDGTEFDFDKLLIATGGIPVIPDIKGLKTNGVFTFTKLSDEQQIESYIEKNKVKNVVVVGAGLIGLKATEALLELKMKVTVVELSDRILAATFDKKASDIIEEALKKVGCKIITKNTVVKINSSKGKVKEVVLKNGHNIKTDMVILAIGVRPNIEFLKDTDIKTDKGIIVDNYMQTSVTDIYAAGDCVQPTVAIWPVAAMQGKIAGYNMAGIKKEIGNFIPMNSVEFCNIPTISAGLTNPAENEFEVLEIYQPEKNFYRKIVLKDNKIVGFIFVGNIDKAGIYTMLIRERIDISSFKQDLLNEDFGLINLPKEFRKHLVTGEGIEV